VRVIGESPVRKVLARGLLVPFRGDIGILEVQKVFCEKIVNTPIPSGAISIERTIFPGRLEMIEVLVGGEENVYKDMFERGQVKILPCIVGCVAYEDITGKKHRTGFIYDLYAKKPADAAGVQAIEISPGCSIAPDQLVYKRNDLGDGPAD